MAMKHEKTTVNHLECVGQCGVMKFSSFRRKIFFSRFLGPVIPPREHDYDLNCSFTILNSINSRDIFKLNGRLGSRSKNMFTTTDRDLRS